MIDLHFVHALANLGLKIWN